MEGIKRISIKAGTKVITENSSSRKLFILKKGKVRVCKDYMGGKVVIATLGPGEIFGELSFFDSKPRSASVEAISDIIADCIDGEQLNEQIKSLPSWVHLVFKSVAERFRYIDQKLAVFEGLESFQKKSLPSDLAGQAVFSALLNMTKVIKLIINEKGNELTRDALLKEIDQILPSGYISAKAYLRVIEEQGYITLKEVQKNQVAIVDIENLLIFEKFLLAKVEIESCLIPSHATLNLMRKMISFLDLYVEEKGVDEIALDEFMQHVRQDKVSLKDNEQCFQELRKIQLLRVKKASKSEVITKTNTIINMVDETIVINPLLFIEDFKHYTIVKSFDQVSL